MIDEPQETQEQNDFSNRLADARVIYEGTHGMSMHDLSKVTGLAKSVLGRQCRAEGWRKLVMKGQTEEASEAVRRFEEYLAATKAAAEETQKTLKDAGIQTAAELKAVETAVVEKVLEQHRREWSAPRALSAEAVRMRDTDPSKSFERAKLAKITAETLKLIQDGERKALGLDDIDLPKGGTLVIERT